eukprot:12939082-Prorocentrum_lima.AAC.1
MGCREHITRALFHVPRIHNVQARVGRVLAYVRVCVVEEVPVILCTCPHFGRRAECEHAIYAKARMHIVDLHGLPVLRPKGRPRNLRGRIGQPIRGYTSRMRYWIRTPGGTCGLSNIVLPLFLALQER